MKHGPADATHRHLDYCTHLHACVSISPTKDERGAGNLLTNELLLKFVKREKPDAMDDNHSVEPFTARWLVLSIFLQQLNGKNSLFSLRNVT